MTETKLYILHDRTIVEAKDAQPCSVCGVAKFWFVNRAGLSTCWSCADVNVLTQGGMNDYHR